MQLVFIPLIAGLSLVQSSQSANYFATLSVEPSLRGVWSVDEFTVDGQLHPPLMSDANRWQRVVLEYTSRLMVQFMDAPTQRYSMDMNTSTRTLVLTATENPRWRATLTYETPQPAQLVFKGQLDGHQVQVVMHRSDVSKFPLTNRGFHWISEYPFNR